VVIRENVVTAPPMYGGAAGGAGIFHQGAGTLTLTNVTIADNVSQSDGGGIYLSDEASALYLKNSTILGNITQRNGGGLDLQSETMHASLVIPVIGDNESQQCGGIYNDGTLKFLNTTVATNRAVTGAGISHVRSTSTATVPTRIIWGTRKSRVTDVDNIHNN